MSDHHKKTGHTLMGDLFDRGRNPRRVDEQGPVIAVSFSTYTAAVSQVVPRSTTPTQISIFPARKALLSMKWRRGSTSSPMSMVNTRLA